MSFLNNNNRYNYFNVKSYTFFLGLLIQNQITLCLDLEDFLLKFTFNVPFSNYKLSDFIHRLININPTMLIKRKPVLKIFISELKKNLEINIRAIEKIKSVLSEEFNLPTFSEYTLEDVEKDTLFKCSRENYPKSENVYLIQNAVYLLYKHFYTYYRYGHLIKNTKF